MPRYTRTVALAITGASGIAYALRLLECLIAAGARVYVMISKPGQIVIGMESKLSLPGRILDMQRFLSAHYNAAPGQLQVLGQDQWTAPVASGSSAPEAMVICPCTTGTLAAVACGASRSLQERAADVMLKERRKLILVVRETPLSEIHLQNMLTLARMGAIIMPANPGFYHCPERIEQLVDFMVARVLDHMNIKHALLPRWGVDTDGKT
ncbi:MAG: flavin prenyltransferase UbiX [Gammaproteobacteria bacterium]|nr:UbiX family flavin prenyltransferase [Gammaproteobacteria bacterium]